MKSILAFSLFVCLCINALAQKSNSAKAVPQTATLKPTKEETLRYVKSLISDMEYGDGTIDGIQVLTRGELKRGELSSIKMMEWKAVTTVRYEKSSEDNWIMYILGEGFLCKDSEQEYAKNGMNTEGPVMFKNKTFWRAEANAQIKVFPHKSLTDAEMQKLVKAVKHLAELNGAKLLKDDLF